MSRSFIACTKCTSIHCLDYRCPAQTIEPARIAPANTHIPPADTPQCQRSCCPCGDEFICQGSIKPVGEVCARRFAPNRIRCSRTETTEHFGGMAITTIHLSDEEKSALSVGPVDLRELAHHEPQAEPSRIIGTIAVVFVLFVLGGAVLTGLQALGLP